MTMHCLHAQAGICLVLLIRQILKTKLNLLKLAPRIFKQLLDKIFVIYTGCIKKMSLTQNRFRVEYLQNYDYQQQPTANIGLQVHISVNFVFIRSIL